MGRCAASELCREDLVVAQTLCFVLNGKVTEEIWLLARLFFPKGFDKLNLKLIIIIRLQVIVVYRTPSVLLGRKGNDILLLRSMWWKFPWNESRLTFWAHCHKTPQKNKFILVVSDYFAKWTESCPIPDQGWPPLLQRSLWATPLICCFGVPCNFIATKELTLN